MAQHAGSAPEAPGWRGAELWAVAGAVVLGLGVRAVVLRSSLGVLNADEATTGLMAQEVLLGRTPLVLAGQNYSGTTESFLSAPLIALFGPSSLVLKLIPTLLWLAVASVTYRVAALVVDRRLAAVLGAVVWVSSFPLVLLSTQAYPGYGSGALAVLVALLLLSRELTAERGDRSVGRRLLLGFCTGFAVWSHPMFVACLLPAHVFLMVRKRTEMFRWVLPNAAGALAGVSPLLAWNAANDWASLEIYPQPPSTYGERLVGFLGDVVPRLLGMRAGAGPGTWVGGGLGITLFVALVALFALALWSLSRGSALERLLAVLVVAVPLLTAVFPTSWYTSDARYGITYFPILVLAAGLGWRRWLPLGHHGGAALLVVPLLCCAVTCVPALAAVTGPAAPGGPNRDMAELIGAVESADVRFVRASYWIAQPLTFLSARTVIASGSDVSRFPDLERQVQQAGTAAVFVAVAGEPQDAELRAALPAHTRQVVAPYVLYLPQPTARNP